jgi:hypothetical protein
VAGDKVDAWVLGLLNEKENPDEDEDTGANGVEALDEVKERDGNGDVAADADNVAGVVANAGAGDGVDNDGAEDGVSATADGDVV